ncbi:Poly(3-hydroxybutyrate) depolymerase [Methylocella tundrae]|uniref:Poly(3-hydroxybutyrate) depolymerase n=1 Tax=Methylocella tundrae TaxID=227605 RepID=A0A8B6MA96_METTU|nr:polyhydroxyalkanoate depolymerase [Methylocella tundrae]VTZ51661.1 Poly(3-hydroxybutyrate) depolymerase [Methylocella tundrae]
MTAHRQQDEDLRERAFGLLLPDTSDRIQPLSMRVVVDRPFGRLVRFERDDSRPRPRVLVVAPISGHRAALLYDMILALAQDHDLYLAQWADASQVALSEGRFGLDENIGYLVDFLHFLGDDLHLIGLCQSALPAVAATAICALRGSGAPRSMTLFGGKIDPRINPTRSDLLARRQSVAWLRQSSIIEVPSPDPGQGRLVYPASLQLATLLAYLTRHILTGGELFRKFMNDDGEYPSERPFPNLFFSVTDLPAEFFLETIVRVFQRFDLPLGRLAWQGETIRLDAIARTALFTVEAEEDDISGAGQTHVAQDLCVNIPKSLRQRYVQPGVGHFGLLHGAVWRSAVLPRLRRFIREQDRGRAPGVPRPPDRSNPSSIIA